MWRWGPTPPSIDLARPRGRSGLLRPAELFRLRERHRRGGWVGVTIALDEAGYLRTVKADTGERMIIECHQLGIGLLAAVPVGKAPSRRNEKVDYGHGSYSCAPLMLRRTRIWCCTAKRPTTVLQTSHAAKRNGR